MTTLRVVYAVDGSGAVVKSFRDVGQAVDQTTGQVRALTQEEKKLIDELDRAGARKRALRDRMGELDDAFRKGIISQGEFRRGTVAAIKDFVGFDRILGVVAGAATAATTAVIGITVAAINNADRINELSNQLSVSSETLSIWGYAAKQSGTDLETVADIVPKLSKRLMEAQDETSKTGKLFKDLKIDPRQFSGVEDALPRIMDLFKQLKSPIAEQALAMELFGRNGADLLEFLNLGSDGLKTMEDRARALGIVMNDQATNAAAEFKDEIENMKAATLGLGANIAQQLLPQMTDTVKRLADLVSNGQLAGNVTSLLSAVLSAGVGVLEAYNRAVSRVQLTMEFLVQGTLGLNDAMRGLATFNFDAIAAGFARIGGSYNASQSRLNEIISGGKSGASAGPAVNPLFGNVRTTVTQISEADQILIRRAMAAEGNGGNSRKSAGKSDEQREAERLAKQYETLAERQRERLALLQEEIATGEKVGAAWKLAYDIQNGELAKLTAGERLAALLREEEIEQLDRRQKAEEKARQERERNTERATEMLAALKEELLVMTMTNDELEIYNNLKRAGVEANSEFGRSIAEQTKLIQTTRQITDAMDGARDIARDFLYDLPNGAADAWKNALDQIEQRLWQWATNGVLDMLLGQSGTTGQGTPGGDVLGGLFGTFFGGGGQGGNPFSGLFNSLLGMFGGPRADGGAVDGGRYGKFYDVTERGLPELLRFGGRQMLMMPPGQQGVVQPVGGGGRGGAYSPTFHFHMGAPTDTRTQQQIAAKAAADSRRALERNS